jgi:hypothetical protein
MLGPGRKWQSAKVSLTSSAVAATLDDEARPLGHHAKESKVPASKSIPVRIALQQRGAEGG